MSRIFVCLWLAISVGAFASAPALSRDLPEGCTSSDVAAAQATHSTTLNLVARGALAWLAAYDSGLRLAEVRYCAREIGVGELCDVVQDFLSVLQQNARRFEALGLPNDYYLSRSVDLKLRYARWCTLTE